MPRLKAGSLIELTMETSSLLQELLAFGFRVFLLSALISLSTAILLFFVVRQTVVLPVKRIVSHMKAFADRPEDKRNIIDPAFNIVELREPSKDSSRCNHSSPLRCVKRNGMRNWGRRLPRSATTCAIC